MIELQTINFVVGKKGKSAWVDELVLEQEIDGPYLLELQSRGMVVDDDYNPELNLGYGPYHANILKYIDAIPGGILVLDHFDANFHPDIAEAVYLSIYETAKRLDVKVVLVTHNLECLDIFLALTNEVQLIRLEEKPEDYHIVVINHADLVAIREAGWEVR